MLKLIGFELKKLFSGKLFWLALVVLLGVNWYLAGQSVDESRIRDEQDMTAFIEEYKADPEAMEAYMQEYNELWRASIFPDSDVEEPESIYSELDFNLFANFAEIRDLTATYRQTVRRARQIAQSRIMEYTYLGYSENSFEMVYQQSVYDSYENLLELEFPLENVVGYDFFFEYEGFCVLLLAALSFIGIMLVTPEKNAGMLLILRCSKKGRVHTFTAKVIAGFLAATFLCVLFTATSLLAFYFRIGLSGGSLPLQMVDSMQLAPFSVSIWGGILLSLGGRILSSCVFLLLILFAASLLRGFLPVFATAFVLIGANYAMATYSFLNDYSLLKNVNFFWSIDGARTLSVWRGVQIFGRCFSQTNALIVVYAVLAVMAFAGGCFFFSRGKGLVRRKWNLRISLPKWKIKLPCARYSVRLYPYEWKKTVTRFSYVVFAIGIALMLYSSDSAYHLQRDYFQELYTSYMQEYEGEWTQEKHETIQAEYQEMMDVLGNEQAMKAQYEAGLISASEYSQFRRACMDAQIARPIMEQVWRQSQYLKEQHDAGYSVAYFDDTGWQQLLDTNLAWISCAVVILLCSDVFSGEYRSGFQKIGNTAKRGRIPASLTKLAVVATVAASFSFLAELCQFLFVAVYSGLPGAGAAAVCIESLAGAGSVPLWVYFGGSVLKNMALCVIVALACAGISRVTKRIIPTLLIMTVIVFAPMIFSYFGISLFENLSYLNLFVR